MANKETIIETDTQVVFENYSGASYFEFEGKPIFPRVYEQWRNADGTVTFALEKLPGTRWGFLWGDDLPFSDHLRIGIKATQQMKFIFETYGLIFIDRSGLNIIVDGLDVYQIDLEAIYDTKSGCLHANERQPWKYSLQPFSDDRITAREIADIYDGYIRDHLSNVMNVGFNRDFLIPFLDTLNPFLTSQGGTLPQLEEVLSTYLAKAIQEEASWK